jgi:hypothetical protein
LALSSPASAHATSPPTTRAAASTPTATRAFVVVMPPSTSPDVVRFPATLDRSMSTRRLIIAALACGLAILVAFAVQITLRP